MNDGSSASYSNITFTCIWAGVTLIAYSSGGGEGKGGAAGRRGLAKVREASL